MRPLAVDVMELVTLETRQFIQVEVPRWQQPPVVGRGTWWGVGQLSMGRGFKQLVAIAITLHSGCQHCQHTTRSKHPAIRVPRRIGSP
jgi:hypothetical protein